MHAAEALTQAGQHAEVLAALKDRLSAARDDRERCGVARELARAGDLRHVSVLFDVLAKTDPFGHVHAAESLFKIGQIGNGDLLRERMAQPDNVPLQLMAAAALARCGHPRALDVVRRRLSADDPEGRRIAAWIIGQLGDKSDAPRLLEIAKDQNDPIAGPYAGNALAALREKSGRTYLMLNLAHENADVRALAAMCAGEGGWIGQADRLEQLLDDPQLDVRLRAAQSLLGLARIERTIGDVSRDVYAATEQNPRYSEGSVIVLRDGSLLFATTEFIGSNSDFAKARIIARQSRDGGQTWDAPRVLQENVGEKNVMSVTLRRLPATNSAESRIGMFYLVKNAFNDLKVALRVSQDETAHFDEPIVVTKEPGYHVLNNDRVTILSTGRLLCPVASTADVEKENHFVSRCWLSDDGGRTWRQGQGAVDQPRRGAMEPEVIELRDGRVLMIVRTQLGVIAASTSSDGGDTWSEPASWGVRSPESPATLRRVPATGDLLLVWNDTYDAKAGHGGKRTPLTAAVSTDEGSTWSQLRQLETRDDESYAYTSLIFDRDRALLSYYVQHANGRISNRFRSLPVHWFYGDGISAESTR